MPPGTPPSKGHGGQLNFEGGEFGPSPGLRSFSEVQSLKRGATSKEFIRIFQELFES